MLRRKQFVKKTKRGSVVTINREHYLRKDIWCGYEKCNVCKHTNPPLEEADIIVPDTNVVLHQIDGLEHAAVKNIVILSTVLDEVRHRDMGIYARVRAMIANPAKRAHVFTNEHFSGTFIETRAGESPNDRNDRAIRTAAQWYAEHIANAAAATGEGHVGNEENHRETGKRQAASTGEAHVLLVTNDVANAQFARGAGIAVASMRTYVTQILKCPEVEDLLPMTAIGKGDDTDNDVNGDKTGSGTKGGAAETPTYAAYLAPSDLQAGLTAGTLVKGTYHASRENATEGYVSVPGRDRRVLLKGVNSINRAIERDIVAVRLLDQSQWVSPSGYVDTQAAVGGAGLPPTEPDAEDTPPVASGSSGAAQPTGVVVGIVRRNWRQYCGVLLPGTNPQQTRRLFAPQDKQVPRIRIQTRQGDALNGKRIVVAIDDWPRDSRYPVGHYVRVLGDVGDADVETEVVLIEHDVPYQPFSDIIHAEMPTLPWKVPEAAYASRRDLRAYNICSIDPPGCTDIDDALHCRPLPNGNVEVGVHIADVTHFIRPGSACDNEAAKRSTTVYLTNRRIDMVPPVLSSNICSLRGEEERFAVSTVWELNPDTAEVVSVEFFKSVIKSKSAMMYSDAQHKIDDATDQSALTKSLRLLNTLAKKLKKHRLDRGALMLASPEVRFNMESETHDPIDVEVKKAMDTHSLVEEFMLLANVTVAQKIFESFPACAMLRRHPVPPGTNFEPLILAAQSANIELDTSSSLGLAKSLDAADNLQGRPYVSTLLRILATRCMLQAVYFCSGTTAESEFKHYGLASDIYTHFTSPIRRYSDIIVHRLLAASIGYCQIFFKDKRVDDEAYVLRVRKNAIIVLVPRYGIEGTVYLDQAADGTKGGGPSLELDADTMRLTVAQGEAEFAVFDRVVVQISVEEKLQTKRICLQLVQPCITNVSVAPVNADAAVLQARDQSKVSPTASATATSTDIPLAATGGGSSSGDTTNGVTSKKKKKRSKKGSKKHATDDPQPAAAVGQATKKSRSK